MNKSSLRKLEYGKEYYERNRERILEARKLRWKNASDELREQQREWAREHYHRNKEKANANTVQWLRENKELVNARARLSRYRKQGRADLIEREEKLIAELLLKKKQN
jgi:hypothetical protein